MSSSLVGKILIYLGLILLNVFNGNGNPVELQENTTSKLGDTSVKDALDKIGTHLTQIQEKLDGTISSTQERTVPHLRFLGRVGSKVYYRSLGLRLPWIDALHFCRSNGMQMAAIDSVSEQLALESFLTPEKMSDPSSAVVLKDFWIGGIRGDATDFYWVQNGRKFGYTNWDVSQPNNPNSEHCVQVWKDTQKWNNALCSIQLPVFCERDLTTEAIF